MTNGGGVLGLILSYVLLYKYAALFVIVYISALIVPLPSNAMLVAVGAFSSQGYFNFFASLAIATVANTLGDLTDYGITRRWGEPAIRKLRFDRVRFFNHLREELRTDAAVTVFTTRFAGSMSTVTNFLAGLVAVPFRTFLLYDFLGNFIEPFCALGFGWLAGDYWSYFSGTVTLAAGIVAASVILFVLARMYRRMLRRYAD
ncbi:MAG TPA: DedA family protein [Candidatus Paceibacterota bacterium]|nr:DedA family protein [Candidatus Paceibacterota bacterium]